MAKMEDQFFEEKKKEKGEFYFCFEGNEARKIWIIEVGIN